MNFVEKVIEQHKELESPENFWRWSALAAISAVMKDQVWLDRGGFYNLYPNIYVMLHADSGLKKGPPVSLAKHLVSKVGTTRVISGRSSIQGILKELGTSKTTPGGGIFKGSVGFIVASEFSSSIVSDPFAMTILTDLYDRQYNMGEYKSLLKMETFNLKDPTITMLVATNEAHFDEFVARKDIQGGFVARTFIISESKVRRLNPLISSSGPPPNREGLVEELTAISRHKGPFHTMDNTPAGKLYEEWYYSFYKQIQESEYKDDTGTVQRFGDSVLKVAMLLCLADNKDNMLITEENVSEAISICEKLVGAVRRTIKKGSHKWVNEKSMIIKELLAREGHKISRQVLLRKYWMYFNSDELDEIMQSFDAAGLILTLSIGNQIIYEMPADTVNGLTEFLAGK